MPTITISKMKITSIFRASPVIIEIKNFYTGKLIDRIQVQSNLKNNSKQNLANKIPQINLFSLKVVNLDPQSLEILMNDFKTAKLYQDNLLEIIVESEFNSLNIKKLIQCFNRLKMLERLDIKVIKDKIFWQDFISNIRNYKTSKNINFTHQTQLNGKLNNLTGRNLEIICPENIDINFLQSNLVANLIQTPESIRSSQIGNSELNLQFFQNVEFENENFTYYNKRPVENSLNNLSDNEFDNKEEQNVESLKADYVEKNNHPHALIRAKKFEEAIPVARIEFIRVKSAIES